MRLLAAPVLLLSVATGCSAVVDDVPGDGSRDAVEDAAVRASVSVQRTESAGAGVRTHVAARFLRATGALDEAERMVDGSALDAAAPLGCSWNDDAGAVGADKMVELLDVGEIVLRARGGEMALAPRAFPDVGGLVSGVVYTSRDGRRDLPDGATYLFEVSGSSAFDGLQLEAEAPSAPDDVRLAGIGLTSGERALRSGDAVDVTWTASSDGDDRIFVAVSDEEEGQSFTCVFEDDGSAEIPGAFLGFDAGAELDVMVHRHRRATIVVPGTDLDAVVDFDFAVAAQFFVTGQFPVE